MTIDKTEVVDRTWYFGLDKRHPVTNALRTNSDGSISGYQHPNERSWRIDESGRLCFFTENGQMSVCFDKMHRINSRIIMSGRHLIGDSAAILHLESTVHGVDRGFSWTDRILEDKIIQYGWEIGEFSYGAPDILDEKCAKLTIGSYCSIGGGVSVALGGHRTDTFTTYPFTSFGTLWSGSGDIPDHQSRGDVVIGSDVWLGAGAFIAPGITIGHGAVVGARSVVTRNVPPYAIVGGNPAKLIRFRHDDETIHKLLNIAWWTWSRETIDAHLPYIMASDIDALQRVADEIAK